MIFYFVHDRIRKNIFPNILVIRKEKPGGFCHRTPPGMAPHNYATNIFKTIFFNKTQKTGKLEP